MKQSFKFFLLSGLVTLASCGGGNKSESTTSDTADSLSTNETILPDAFNSSQEYSQYVTFGDIQGFKVDDGGSYMVEVEVIPQIKMAANQINDNMKTELILLDANGKQLISLHQFGRNSAFEKALSSGDTYNSGITFIGSADTEENARNIVNNAKYFQIVMPLTDVVEEEEITSDTNEDASIEDISFEDISFDDLSFADEMPSDGMPSDNYTNKKADNDNKAKQADNDNKAKQADWNPQGTYDFEDGEGRKLTLVIKKGGNAELINHAYDGNSQYKPTKGTWSQAKGKGYITLKFFSGPIVKIGGSDILNAPVLTPEYLYHDLGEYKKDGACVEVKKVK